MRPLFPIGWTNIPLLMTVSQKYPIAFSLELALYCCYSYRTRKGKGKNSSQILERDAIRSKKNHPHRYSLLFVLRTMGACLNVTIPVYFGPCECDVTSQQLSVFCPAKKNSENCCIQAFLACTLEFIFHLYRVFIWWDVGLLYCC